MCPPRNRPAGTLLALAQHRRKAGTILPPHGRTRRRAGHTPLRHRLATGSRCCRRTARVRPARSTAPRPPARPGRGRGGARRRAGSCLLPSATTATTDPIRLALHEAGCVLLDTRSAAGSGPALWLARRDPFRIRALAPGEEVRLGALFTRCFHVSRAGEEWRWRYRDHPHGGPWSSIAVAGDGEIVALRRLPVRLEQRECSSGRPSRQVGDLMSAPDLRVQGAVGRPLPVPATTYAARRRDGVAFSWRAPAPAVSPYVSPAPFRSCRRHCGCTAERVWPGARAPDASAAARRWRARRVAAPDARFDAFHERARRTGSRPPRPAHLAWRYFSRPAGGATSISPNGAGCSAKDLPPEDGRLVWGDALVAPEAAAAAPPCSPPRSGRASVTTVGVSPAAGGGSGHSPRPARAPDPQGLVFTAVAGCEPVPAARLGADFYLTRGDSDLF